MPSVKPSGKYPAAWNDIAFGVKQAAKMRCVRCGHVHDPATGYTLTVHHFDGRKDNCELWNLMPLCQRCHLSVQGRVDPEVPLMFEPNTWAMPYIAGFYEAGRGIPGPCYVLSDWIEHYMREHGPWPSWAPRQQNRLVG